MEKGFVENGFIIDLSSTTSTNQLVFELSSIMEHPDVKGKRVCLKLGNQDLKQSQLLSIKALVESMNAQIAFVETTSEQTEASAVSLGIIISKVGEKVETAISSPVEPTKEEEVVAEKVVEDENIDKTVEIHADENQISREPINTIEGVEDVYTEQSTEEISEIIPVEHFETEFEKLAASEGLISKDDLSKYIILDTGDV